MLLHDIRLFNGDIKQLSNLDRRQSAIFVTEGERDLNKRESVSFQYEATCIITCIALSFSRCHTRWSILLFFSSYKAFSYM